MATMGKIRIGQIEQLDRQVSDAADPDERRAGDVSTTGLLAAANDPIHVRLHRMAPGGRIAWQDSSRGHLAYVWEGYVSVGGRRLGPGSMIIVEHRASGEAVADGEAALLVFNTSAASQDIPGRPGGHVHLLAADDVPRAARLSDAANVGAAVYANSDCATCEFWLHGNDFHDADFPVAPHFHSEDEVIVVTGGEIVLGLRRYGRGTVIGIPQRTVYGFHTGPEGLSFINFRPGRPSYGLSGATETIDERSYYKKIPPPQYADGSVAIA
jgi:quercetin dioxygenase-like cupin family protein